ncbi:MAG TPA: DUF1579 family protein [Fimbriiglobus sp.]|nr:DUF1579 family protein [Fimbriiglobus sp.]
MTIISRLLVLAGLLTGTAIGAGQPPEKKDPQSSVEPRSGPGAGQKFLERFVGTWDVVKTFHPRTGEPIRAKGECRQEMIHGGRFLRSEFVFDGATGKTTGTGLIGFESQNGLFTSVWIDSRRTAMSFRRSKEKFDGQQIVLHGATVAGAGDGRKSRTVTRLEEGDTRIVHRQYGDGPGGKERLVMELVMTRKPGR